MTGKKTGASGAYLVSFNATPGRAGAGAHSLL